MASTSHTVCAASGTCGMANLAMHLSKAWMPTVKLTFEALLPSASARTAWAAAEAAFSLRAFRSSAICRFWAGLSSAASSGGAPAARAASWAGALPAASARSASAASSAMRSVDLPAEHAHEDLKLLPVRGTLRRNSKHTELCWLQHQHVAEPDIALIPVRGCRKHVKVILGSLL